MSQCTSSRTQDVQGHRKQVLTDCFVLPDFRILAKGFDHDVDITLLRLLLGILNSAIFFNKDGLRLLAALQLSHGDKQRQALARAPRYMSTNDARRIVCHHSQNVLHNAGGVPLAEE